MPQYPTAVAMKIFRVRSADAEESDHYLPGFYSRVTQREAALSNEVVVCRIAGSQVKALGFFVRVKADDEAKPANGKLQKAEQPSSTSV